MAGAYKDVKEEPQEHVAQPRQSDDPNFEAKGNGDIGTGSGRGAGFGKSWPHGMPRTPSHPYSPIAAVPTTPRPKGPPLGPPPATPSFHIKHLPPVPVFGGGPAAPASSQGNTADSDYPLLATYWTQWHIFQQERRNHLDWILRPQHDLAITQAFAMGRQIGCLEERARAQQAMHATESTIMNMPQPW